MTSHCPPDQPHLFRNIISDIRHIPHSEEGVKAGAFPRFMHIGVIGESILMGDCCKEHFEANYEILQAGLERWLSG